MSKKQIPPATPLLRLFFVCYAVLLLWLLFDRTPGWSNSASYTEALRGNMNLIPFLTIGNYWHVVKRMDFSPIFYHCVINLGGNIFLFIPIGYFLPRLWTSLRNFFLFLPICTLAITLVEVLQLLTLLGSLDIDDLILNLIGMTAGFLFFHIFKK